jgi:hypothetical protein
MFFKNLKEQVTVARGVEERPSLIAAECEKVQVARAIETVQVARHGGGRVSGGTDAGL